jgi:hypothetical protein
LDCVPCAAILCADHRRDRQAIGLFELSPQAINFFELGTSNASLIASESGVSVHYTVTIQFSLLSAVPSNGA